MTKQLTVLVLCLLGTLPSAMANQLEKIGFSTLPGNRVQVNLSFSGATAMPLNFSKRRVR